MTEQFSIDEVMKLTNVNPRNEKHGDKEELAVDLTLQGIFDVDDCKLLMTSIDMAAFKKTFWHPSGHPIAEHHLGLVTKLEGYKVQVSKPGKKVILKKEDAAVSGFKIDFNHGHTVKLSFKIQFNCDSKAIGNACEYLNDEVLVQIESGPQEEMDQE